MAREDHGTVVIRATVEHLELLAPMFDGCCRFYKQPSDPERARRFPLERLGRGESVVFLAVQGEAGVGFTRLYPSFSSISAKRVWILNDVHVVPEAGQRGIASALLARDEELKAAKDNPARRLYERKGWQQDEAFYYYSLGV